MSKNGALPLILVLLAASCLIMIKPAEANSRTIIVTTSSELTNAINYAEDGDTILVKKGIYDMPKNQTLVIGRSISLIGEDAQSTAIILHPPWVATGGFHLGGNGVEPDYAYDNPIKIQASNVTVSGFTLECDVGRSILTTGDRIQMVGNIFKTGLFMYDGSHQNIAQNTFAHSDIQCYGSYNTIAGNIILGHSIVAGASGSFNFICGNTITDGYGIHLVTKGNIVFNNTVRNCSYGVTIASMGASSDNVVCQNILTNNEIGLSVPSGEKNNVLYANEVAYNQQGVVAVYWSPPKGVNTFYHNNFVGNARQVNTDSIMVLDGSTTVAAYHSGSFDDGKEGNYWSDYSGNDADGNGVGDSPYVIDANRSDHYPLMTLFNISNVTLELPEWAYPLPSQPPPALPSPTTSPSPLESPSPSMSPDSSPSASASPSSSSTPQATSEPTQSAQPSTEPFPTVPVLAAFVIVVVIVVAGLLVYHKKRGRGKNLKPVVAAVTIILIIGISLIASPYVYIPKTVSEPYQAVRSSAILDETFTLGNDRIAHTVYLNKGEIVNVQIAVNGEEGEATFMVFDDSAEYIQEHGANFTYNRNWTVPLSANYSFMYVKHGLYTPAITVTELVTKFRTETAYRDVTTSCRLLPFEVLYLGAVLTIGAVVGFGLLVYFKKRKKNTGDEI